MWAVTQLFLFPAGLVALPWLGVKVGGRPVIVGIAAIEILAVIGLAWSVRAADIGLCGDDELCINEMTGAFDNIAVWPILFLLIFIAASAFLAFDRKAQRTARNA
jgi:hypothetical protein